MIALGEEGESIAGIGNSMCKGSMARLESRGAWNGSVILEKQARTRLQRTL